MQRNFEYTLLYEVPRNEINKVVAVPTPRYSKWSEAEF